MTHDGAHAAARPAAGTELADGAADVQTALDLGCQAMVLNHALWDAALVARVHRRGPARPELTVNDEMGRRAPDRPGHRRHHHRPRGLVQPRRSLKHQADGGAMRRHMNRSHPQSRPCRWPRAPTLARLLCWLARTGLGSSPIGQGWPASSDQHPPPRPTSPATTAPLPQVDALRKQRTPFRSQARRADDGRKLAGINAIGQAAERVVSHRGTELAEIDRRLEAWARPERRRARRCAGRGATAQTADPAALGHRLRARLARLVAVDAEQRSADLVRQRHARNSVPP